MTYICLPKVGSYVNYFRNNFEIVNFSDIKAQIFLYNIEFSFYSW